MYVTILIQVTLFEKPVLAKNDIFAYARSAELGATNLTVNSKYQLRFNRTRGLRGSDESTKIKVSRPLKKEERAELDRLLTKGEWDKRSWIKKADPMWPGAFDGADVVMVAKIGKTTQVWANRDYDGAQGSRTLEEWCANVITAKVK